MARLNTFQRRKYRSRKRVKRSGRPRLTVYRSLSHIYAQIIDDEAGQTLAASSTLALGVKGNKTEAAKQVGADIAKKAASKGIKQVVFDRGAYKFHGRVKALAEAAREAGLEF